MSIVKDLLFILIILFLFIKCVYLKSEIRKQRNYFIDTLRHDLRVSAIAQIRGLEFLKKQNLLASQAEFVNEILNSCKFSLDMLNMLLNTFKYESGEQVLNCEDFSISDKLYQVSDMLYSLAEKKYIKFFYDIENSLVINADKANINKVLMIFMTTAISYADKNSQLRIHLKKYLNTFKISIIYKGKPLSLEERKRMFLNNPKFSTVGYGIKMQFCKKIIDFHNGRVFYENYGKNINAFTFVLPIRMNDKSTKINNNKHLNTI